jgi:hypothetical protein
MSEKRNYRDIVCINFKNNRIMINILKLAFLTASAVSLQIIQCKVAGKAAEIFNKIIKYEK